MDRTMDIDRAYANGDFIEGSAQFPQRWAKAAAEFRESLAERALPDQSYGSGDRQKFDLFLPRTAAKGLLVFVHGGYWLAFGRESWSHLATGALARGWACAMPSYTLAPAARISAITAEVAAAVRAASALVAGPVVVSGHSAGGHLAARMGCADIELPMVKRVVPISPVAELAPLMQTKMNQNLKIDPDEADRESPARLRLRDGVQAHVWVGAQERPAFLWQARTLSEDWACRWTAAVGKHHFDVIDDLMDPNSALIAACLDHL